jgi:hypothetical protein
MEVKMRNPGTIKLSRRSLVFKGIPTCTAICLGVSNLSANNCYIQQEVHKFDKEMVFPRPLTYRQFLYSREVRFIRFCKLLVEEIGEDKALKIIRKYTQKRLFDVGQRGAKRKSENSFKSYIDMFKQPEMTDTLSIKIIKDTDSAFEIKITECLSHEIYKAEGFDGKFGYACVCHGDFAWAEGYNPKIKLIRDKTLMQGHDCCNHKYLWIG